MDKGPYKAMTGTSRVMSILPVRIMRRKFLGMMKRKGVSRDNFQVKWLLRTVFKDDGRSWYWRYVNG